MRPGILHGMSIDHVLDLINVIAQTPPSYSHSEFCGVPINALLIDLINTEFGKSLFSHPRVNDHLKNIFNDYGSMLKTKRSLMYLNHEEGGWLSEDALKEINYNDFVCDQSAPHYGFQCWNDWFTRKLAPKARPVDNEDDPLVIVHAAENYPLTTLELPFLNVKKTDKFWLKENRYSLYDMFDAEVMGVKHIIDESFVGGTIYQGFLSPWCYHWWHTPVSGTIERSYLLPGSYFLQNPSFDMSGINNYDNSQAFLSCVSARHVFIINTHNPDVGRVAIIEIGMVEVSSCISIVNVGDEVKKGEPIGRFEFGGSSHVIVFDKKAKLDFNPKIYDREDSNGF
jgi:phosphatidylserine decarboxylase